MTKEVYNKKRSIFCGPLEKRTKEEASEVLCVESALYRSETWTLGRNRQIRKEAFQMWMWRKMECVKWTDKNAVVLERVGEGRTMVELIKKRKRNCLGHCHTG